MRRLRIACAFAATSLALACGNAGENRLLSVATSGVVKGLIFFDMDGNLVPGAGDDSVRNIHVKLVDKNSGDSVAAAVSLISGSYRMGGVPVGTYRIVVDTTPLADTARVVKLDSTEVTVRPNDSSQVLIAVSYPHISIARARSAAVPLGRKVFIEGITLNALNTFTDTTVYVQDTSAAIRAARIRSTSVQAADSVRMRGTINVRAGQRTIEDVTVFLVNPLFQLPLAQTVTSAQAASAAGGTRDAQQLRVHYVTVTDTLPVPGGFRLMVNDSTLTGALEVLLDVTAFNLPTCPGASCIYNPGKRFDIIGLATPTSTAGIWRLKPRSVADAVALP